MNDILNNIDSLLKYISFTFLIYCTLTYGYKLLAKKKYSIIDFRISIMTLIFVFFKFSLSLLWFYTDMIFNIKNFIVFLIILLGFYSHNKVTEPRKKFFRLFSFYFIGLLLMI